MNPGKKVLIFFVFLVILLLQIIATQVVTFIVSLVYPGLGDLVESQPVLFISLVTLAYTFGIFLVGWLALRWLHPSPRLPLRLLSTLLCAVLPMLIALVFLPPLVQGHPSFLIAVLTGALGFHLPGRVPQK